MPQGAKCLSCFPLLGQRDVRKELEKGEPVKDYRQELLNLFGNQDKFFDTPHKLHVAGEYKKFFLRVCAFATNEDYKAIYEGLAGGDPKLRTLRALFYKVYGGYLNTAQKTEVKRNG